MHKWPSFHKIILALSGERYVYLLGTFLTCVCGSFPLSQVILKAFSNILFSAIMSSPSGSQITASTTRATKGASPASSDRSIGTSTQSSGKSGTSSPTSSDRSLSSGTSSLKNSASPPSRARLPARSPEATRQGTTTAKEPKTPNSRNVTAPANFGYSPPSSSSPDRSTSGAGPSHARQPPGAPQTTPGRDTQTTLALSPEAEQLRDQLLHAKCKLITHATSIRQATPGSADAREAWRQLEAQKSRIDDLTRQFDAAISGRLEG